MFARISSVAYNGKHIRFVCAMIPVADPGFSGRGGTNLLFGIIFAENYMKMKQQCIPVGCVLTLAQHVWWPLLSVSSGGIPPLVHDQERGTHPPPGHTHPLDIPTPRHTHPWKKPNTRDLTPPPKGHGTRDTHLPPNAFENITFLQLRLRAEKLNSSEMSGSSGGSKGRPVP